MKKEVKIGLSVVKSPAMSDKFSIFIDDREFKNNDCIEYVLNEFIGNKGYEIDYTVIDYRIDEFFNKNRVVEVIIRLKNGNSILFDMRFEGVNSNRVEDYFSYLEEKLNFILNKLAEEWAKQPFINAYIEKYV